MTPFHLFLAIICPLFWGLNIVVSKIGIQEFPPFFFAFLRFAVILPGLFFFSRPKGITLFQIAQYSMVLGFLQFSFYNMALAAGLTAGMAGLLCQLTPFFIMFLSYVKFNQKPSKSQIIGLLVALIGVFLIGFQTGLDATLSGFVLMVLAAFCLAWATMLVKIYKVTEPASLTCWASCLSVIPFALVSLWFEPLEVSFLSLKHASWAGYFAPVYAGWISMMFGGSVWVFLVKTYSPNQISPYALLVPVWSLIFSTILLHETVTPLIITAGLLIVAGLSISQFSTFFSERLKGRLF